MCVMAIGGSMRCSDGRAVATGRIRRGASHRKLLLDLAIAQQTPMRWVKAKLRDDRKPATRSNETWAMDFVHGKLASG